MFSLLHTFQMSAQFYRLINLEAAEKPLFWWAATSSLLLSVDRLGFLIQLHTLIRPTPEHSHV
jgi:hypothetical protein